MNFQSTESVSSSHVIKFTASRINFRNLLHYNNDNIHKTVCNLLFHLPDQSKFARYSNKTKKILYLNNKPENDLTLNYIYMVYYFIDTG